MELRQLEAFVAVAEERNFTRAATRLIVAVEGLQRGTLSLGIMQTTWMFDLPGLLASYRGTYPGIELRLRHASSADLGRMLRAHAVDVAFRSAAESPDEILSVTLATPPLVVVCGTGHALAGRSATTLRALADVALVGYPPGWGIRTLADGALRASGLEPHYAFEGNDTQVLLDLVEAGLGVALFPEALASSRAPRLHTLAIRGRRWDWTIRAQALAPLPPSPAARALWNMLVDRG